MGDVLTKHYCQNCKKELSRDQESCSHCGSEKRHIEVEINEGINIKVNLRGRQKCKGFKKFMVEFLQGWFPSINKEKYPEGVNKMRIINRENPNREGSYQEKVVDAKTGEIIREVKEVLRKHRH